MIGQTLSHYEILEKLGSGGMGEVYLARDTKLERDVAIKVLPRAFSQDPERLARLEREAKLLASLNHANIATLHGLDEAEGVRYLVMELVPGETLRERLKGGPLAIEDALEIARQVADALEAAHENGIIHRDLKPANIKVTPEGKVKVLDFGLAKAFAAEGLSEDPSSSPTLSAAGTRAGVLLGTAAYMSPEQARGQSVDKRSDIFSFGLVLYEMLTGRQAFRGETVSDILASVLKSEPEWTTLPADLDSRTRELLRRCMKKDPRERQRDIGDVRIEIQEVLASPDREKMETVAAIAAQSKWRPMVFTGVGSILVCAIIASLVVWNLKLSPAPGPVKRFGIVLPSTTQLTSTNHHSVSLSPGGKRLVY